MNPQAQVAAEPCRTRIALALETLHRFGTVRMRTTGGSMLPAIAPGDVLRFRTCAHHELRVGQVVLASQQDRLVVHRIVEANSQAVTTRGDALAADDAPLSRAAVLGVLIGHQRGTQELRAGGRHWLRRQRMARWVLRRVDVAHALMQRLPGLATLAA